MRLPTLVRGAVLLAAIVAAGVAAAADMPRAYRHSRIAYEPRGPALVYAPRYRVLYQVPSDDCAYNDFCSEALAPTPRD